MKNIKVKILLLCFIFWFTHTLAQNSAGRIVYERKLSWTKLYTKATFLNQEEKERLIQTYKNDEANAQNMVLDFNEKKSYYSHENVSGQSKNGDYTWRNGELIIYRDFENKKLTNIEETMSKTYIVEDSLQFLTWKIMNEIKEVYGYICMRALAKDTVMNREIEAWFATDLPVPTGPETFGGLPGLILEANIDKGTLTLIASSIKLQNDIVVPSLPKKLKGKRVDLKTFNAIVKKYIIQQESVHNSPYFWGGLRY